MKIRKATMKDAERILQLLNSDKKLSVNGRIGDFNKYDVTDYITKKICETFVYEENDKIIGAIVCQFWSKYFHINLIVVDREYQRKGVGKSLIKSMESMAKKRGIEDIELITEIKNTQMQSLLKKLKYKRVHKFFAYSKEI